VRARIAAALLGVLVLAVGCGDSSTSPKPVTRSERSEPPKAQREGALEDERREREEALSSIPNSDRLAYVQLGAAIGTLSQGASMVVVNDLNRGKDSTAMERVRVHLGELRPRDPALRRLRRRILAELGRSLRERRHAVTARRGAPRTLRMVQGFVKSLRAYGENHPKINALFPD
jgi:hypothetical protein